MSKSFWIYSSLLFGLVFIGLVWLQLNVPPINIILIPFLVIVSIILAITFEEDKNLILSAVL